MTYEGMKYDVMTYKFLGMAEQFHTEIEAEFGKNKQKMEMGPDHSSTSWKIQPFNTVP